MVILSTLNLIQVHCVLRGHAMLDDINLEQPITIGQNRSPASCDPTVIDANNMGQLWILMIRSGAEQFDWDESFSHQSAATLADDDNIDALLWSCGIDTWNPVTTGDSESCPEHHARYPERATDCNPGEIWTC